MSSPAPVLTAVLKKRRLVRKPVVATEPALVACPHCGKGYKNVEEHITKTHKTNRLVFTESLDEGRPYLTAKELTYNGITWTPDLFGWGDAGSGDGEAADLCGVPDTPEFKRKFGKGWTHLHILHNFTTLELTGIQLYNAHKNITKELYIHTVTVVRKKDY